MLLDNYLSVLFGITQDFAPTLCFYDVTHGKEKCGQDGSYYNEEEVNRDC